MRVLNFCFVILIMYTICSSCSKDDAIPDSSAKNITLRDFQLDNRPSALTYANSSVLPQVVFTFSEPIDHASAQSTIVLSDVTGVIPMNFIFSNHDSIVTVQPQITLKYLTSYIIQISSALISTTNKKLDSDFTVKIITTYSTTDKFPRIPDNELLDLVQKQTLKYFYDFADPSSGMARERNTSGSTVTTGGTGFGIMAVIAGMDRNFISRSQGIAHMTKMVTFLEKADRFHGAWSHWINGSTGKVIPFSTKDNGGDLVETSFLIEGLITFRQYLKPADTVGNNLIKRITKLYDGVEWDWYRKSNENVLYWHWSPNYNWDMNFPLYGYFEEQITYVLAAGSSTHSIPKIVYTNGYGKNGGIITNKTYFAYKLPLGGLSPLFFVHYSYLGLNPHFRDDYANYWDQN
ncbi:MAG TPA: glucoamylase family protein, partial [Mucilaginibacter sp.]|nr:glucoamylase family protein [Mucilaginibacter sp.]